MVDTEILVDFALQTIGEQTLQLKMRGLELAQAQKELAELKKENDPENPDNA